MKRLTVLLTAVIICLQLSANKLLDDIVSRGNRAYLLGQREEILECAHALGQVIPKECTDSADRRDYTFSMLKLYGNYHYERASLEPASLQIAEDFYNKAKAVGSSQISKMHLPDLELAQLYYRDGRYAEALTCVDRAIEHVDTTGICEWDDPELANYLMQRAICLARLARFDEAVTVADDALSRHTDTNSLDYARAQRMKAKTLMLSAKRPSEAIAAYKEYFKTQREYIKRNFSEMDADQREQYWLMLRPFVADCYTLESLDPGFLYDVTLFAKGILLHVSRHAGAGKATVESLAGLDYTWRDIQGMLKPGQAATEFIQYERDGVQHMAALIVKPRVAPQFIQIIDPEQFEELAGKDFQSTTREGKDHLYCRDDLARSVMTPKLLEALKGVKRLYFAPDGFLHKYAIEYTDAANGLEMYRLTSTRRLVEPPTPATLKATLYCGGIDYGFRRGAQDEVKNDSVAYSLFRRVTFPRLSSETNEALRLYDTSRAPADTLLTGSQASEDIFRALAPQFENILVSTHGDFRASNPGTGTDLKPVVSDEAMSQNIVAFAGVNSALRRAGFDAGHTCDGLLSAHEIGNLDLSNCQLFTLSACQTGLGQITSDGVFGLQRGLKNAGVGAMLLSLWNVNSQSTAILIENFYQNLATGMTLRRAFLAARERLKQSQSSEGQPRQIFNPATMSMETVTETVPAYNTPQFTDAFLLIDALE